MLPREIGQTADIKKKGVPPSPPVVSSSQSGGGQTSSPIQATRPSSPSNNLPKTNGFYGEVVTPGKTTQSNIKTKVTPPPLPATNSGTVSGIPGSNVGSTVNTGQPVTNTGSSGSGISYSGPITPGTPQNSQGLSGSSASGYQPSKPTIIDKNTIPFQDYIKQQQNNINSQYGTLSNYREQNIGMLKTNFNTINESNKNIYNQIKFLESYPVGTLFTITGDNSGKEYTREELISRDISDINNSRFNIFKVTKGWASNAQSLSKSKKDIDREQRWLNAFSSSVQYPDITTVTIGKNAKGEQTISTYTKPSDIVTKMYGSERLDIYGAKALQDWFLPEAIAGAATITGIDKNAWENLHQQYAQEIISNTRKTGEDVLSYAGRFWNPLNPSSGALQTEINIATLGISEAVSPFTSGLKTIDESSKLGKIISWGRSGLERATLKSNTINKLFTAYKTYPKLFQATTAIGLIGAPTAYNIYTNPSATPLILGRTSAGLGQMYGSFKAGSILGAKEYSYFNKGSIQSGYWTGTEYEQGMLSNAHRISVLESQYSPYEFGTGSSRYTAIMKPTQDKFPYVPMHPDVLHVTTRGFMDASGDTTMGFILRRPTVSKEKWSYEVSTPTVEKDFFINTGKMKTGTGVNDLFGISKSKYIGDLGDISVSKIGGKGMSGDYFEGTSLSKTFPMDESFPGKFGMITKTDTVEMTSILSRSSSSRLDVYESGWMYRYMKKGKDNFGGGNMGFDISSNVGSSKIVNELHMPGGIGDFGEQSLWRKIDYQGSFPTMNKPRKMSLSELEEGTDIRSSHWTGTVQSQKISSLSAFKQVSIQGSIMDSIQLFSPIHSQRQNQKTISGSLNIQKSMMGSISLQRSMLNQVSIQDVEQVTTQRTIIHPVVTPFIHNKTLIKNTFWETEKPVKPYKTTWTPPPFFPDGGSMEGGGSGAFGLGRRRKSKTKVGELRIPTLKDLFGG
jgi:hypothetical protein